MNNGHRQRTSISACPIPSGCSRKPTPKLKAGRPAAPFPPSGKPWSTRQAVGFRPFSRRHEPPHCAPVQTVPRTRTTAPHQASQPAYL